MSEELENAQKLLEAEKLKRSEECKAKLGECLKFIEDNGCVVDVQQLWRNGQPGPLQLSILPK